ncbi:MAG: hypothetical protein SGBAC_013596 [Bacillariaceae sp.]
MAPDGETQKKSRIGSSTTLLADELSHGDKSDKNSAQEDSFQNILICSLDQAIQVQQELPSMALITDTVEEIGTAASQTIASMRVWSTDNETGMTSASTTERKISDLQSCLKPAMSIDDEETMVTYDSAEENAMMLQRLASWNTMETGQTMEVDERGPKDGAKKSVKFDYPPVQSMSEIPRLNPKDVPNLFYSEEELAQLHGDRFSTISAEEVEVVAIPPTEESQGEEEEEGKEEEAESSGGIDANDASQRMQESSEMDSDDTTDTSTITKLDQEEKVENDDSIEEGQSSYNVKILATSINAEDRN